MKVEGVGNSGKRNGESWDGKTGNSTGECPPGLTKIGSLHEISIAFRYTWSESVFHADSHGIFYFFFKSAEMCVFLI